MEQFVSQFGGVSSPPQPQQFVSQFGGVTKPPEPQEVPSTPSPFGSNRGVAPPNSNSPDDFNKSMISGAEQAPMWLGDTANALTQGITRTAGAAYQGIGGDLSPEQAEKLTNPTLPFKGSREVYKDAGMPLYDPKTSLGIFGQLLGNAGGMTGIGEAAPLVDVAGSKIADAAKSVPEGVGLRARGAMAKDAEARDAESEALSNDTSAKYAAFDKTGARLTDESANDFNNTVRKSYADIKIDPVASPKTVSALKNIYQRVTQGKVDPITGEITQEPLSVGEIDQYRRQLARASYGEDTAAASAARKAIDDHLNNLSNEDFVGGDSGNAINKLTAARAAAAKEFKFNDLLDIQKKAGGDPNAIKRLVGKYLDQNPAGLSDEEIQTLKRAATRSPAEFLERGLGTFGLDFGKVKNVALPTMLGENATKGAAALLPHGAPLVGAGTVARQTGKWAARGALEDAINAIAKRDTSIVSPPPAPPQAPMLALPAPKTTVYGNTAGQNITQTEAERASVEPSAGTAAEGRPSAAAQAEQALQQKRAARAAEDEAEIARDKAARENIPKPAASMGGKTIEELAAANADKNNLGGVGKAFLNMGKNIQGSVPPAVSIGAGGAALAGAAAKGSIGQKNQDELQKLQFPAQPQHKPQASLPDVSSFIKAESGGNPNAKNPNSSASGLYQFTNKTWNDMVSRHGKQTGINFGDKNNPQAQATMASLLAKDNITSLQKSLGRMPTKPELYMAHFLGAHGASKLINAPANQEAIMLFPRQVFDSNRQIFFDKSRPRTVAEVQQLLANKVA